MPSSSLFQQSHFDGACLHELLERQVASTPQRVAAVHEGEELTYDQLNRRANQLAHHLRSLGVGPEVRVGICMERSLELLVGILGILKAGGAYVPLEPQEPSERLRYKISEAQATILVTQGPLAPGLPEYHGPVIDLTANSPAIAQCSEQNPLVSVRPMNLAYVMFTSGSTGKPKGVAVTHANVVRLFAVTQPHFCFTDADVWTLFHSYAFDFSVWELWGALLFGGKLLVLSYLQSRSPETFYELLFTHRVTILNQTPTAFREFLDVDATRSLPLALRFIIFGGEALNPTMLREWAQGHPQTRLVNMYGITETTVHVTLGPLSEENMRKHDSAIGSCLSDLQLYLLDEQMNQAPAGEVGELYVGGAGVTRGYLNRPDTTAARYVADPFAGQRGARMYRTGDQARRAISGELEFLGRLDNQVKIRGHRIELGEIEAVLIEHQAVRDAVVLLREARPGEEVLVAYVTTSEAHFNEANVRKHVSERLPDYMAPVAYVVLESLPLTVNGKLDRAALPEPEWVRPDLLQPYVAPNTAVQETLCEIWSRVLGVEPIGIEDDFFDLGGHSLLATELISQVRQVFGIHIELRSLFDASTVVAFAEVIEQVYAEQQEGQNALLDNIEDLSTEQVELMLSKHRDSDHF